MEFDPNNKIIQLCAQGMDKEGNLEHDEAKLLFQRAWDEASTDFEKCVAAHYIARHQQATESKLIWDERALTFAKKINDENMLANYPSLYLNIGKCYEELKDFEKAAEHYQLAFDYMNNLADDGYGQMIRSGIKNGISRVSGQVHTSQSEITGDATILPGANPE